MSCLKSQDINYVKQKIRQQGIAVTELETGSWEGSDVEVGRLKALLEASFPMLVQAPKLMTVHYYVQGAQRRARLTVDMGRLKYASIAYGYDWPVAYDAEDAKEVEAFLATYLGSLGADVTTEDPQTGQPMNTLSQLLALAAKTGRDPAATVLGWLAHPDAMPAEAVVTLMADSGFFDLTTYKLNVPATQVGTRTVTVGGQQQQVPIYRIDYDKLYKQYGGHVWRAQQGQAAHNNLYLPYREVMRRLKRYSVEEGLHSYRTLTEPQERMYVSLELARRQHVATDVQQLTALFEQVMKTIRRQIDIYKKLHDKDKHMRYARMLRLLERLSEEARPEMQAVIALNQLVNEMNWHLRVLARMQALPPRDRGAHLKSLRDAYLFASTVEQMLSGIALTGVMSKETRNQLEGVFNWLSSSSEALLRLYRTDGYDMAAQILMEGAEGYVQDADELKRVMLTYRDSFFDPVILALNIAIGGPTTTASDKVRIFQRFLSEQYGKVKQKVNAIIDELERLDLGWWAYETEGGKRTGWLVTPRSWRRWKEARDNAIKSWAKVAVLPDTMEAQDIFNFFSLYDPIAAAEVWPGKTGEERYRDWERLRNSYVAYITNWHSVNSQVHTSALDRIISQLEQIERDYGEDLTDLKQGVTKKKITLLAMSEDDLRRRYPRSYHALIDYRDTIAAGGSTRAYGIYEPNDRYDNPEWKKLTPQQRSAIDHLISLRRRLDRLLPYGFGNEYAVPNVREGGQLEMVLGRTTQEMEDAIRRSLIVLTPDGREVLAPPIYYSRIPDEPDRLAHPLFAYASYAHMVYHYAMMGHARLAVEATEDALQHREGSEESLTRIQKWARDLTAYTVRMLKESSLYDIGFKPMARWLDYMADIVNMMAVIGAFFLDPVSVTVLMTTAQTVSLQESVRHHFYGIKDFMRAVITYAINMPRVLFDAFRWHNQSKVQRFIRYSDVLMSYQHRLRRDRRFLRSVNRGGIELEDVLTLANGLHPTEHAIAGIFVLALGYGTKAMYNGAEYSVYELMDSSGNFPDGATFKSNGRPLTQATWAAYVQRAHATVHAPKGETHTSLARRYKILGSFAMFRSWVAPIFMRWFGPEYYDDDVNGMRSSILYTYYKLMRYLQYYTMYRDWKKVSQRLKEKEIAHWDKSNTTAIVEMLTVISIYLALSRLIAWLDEFMEQYGREPLDNFWRYVYAVTKASQRELVTPVDVEQWLRILTPSGPITMAVHISKAIGSVVHIDEYMQGNKLIWPEEVKQGSDKGVERWRVELRKALGTNNLLKQIQKMDKQQLDQLLIDENEFRFYRTQ